MSDDTSETQGTDAPPETLVEVPDIEARADVAATGWKVES